MPLCHFAWLWFHFRRSSDEDSGENQSTTLEAQSGGWPKNPVDDLETDQWRETESSPSLISRKLTHPASSSHLAAYFGASQRTLSLSQLLIFCFSGCTFMIPLSRSWSCLALNPTRVPKQGSQSLETPNATVSASLKEYITTCQREWKKMRPNGSRVEKPSSTSTSTKIDHYMM